MRPGGKSNDRPRRAPTRRTRLSTRKPDSTRPYGRLAVAGGGWPAHGFLNPHGAPHRGNWRSRRPAIPRPIFQGVVFGYLLAFFPPRSDESFCRSSWRARNNRVRTELSGMLRTLLISAFVNSWLSESSIGSRNFPGNVAIS